MATENKSKAKPEPWYPFNSGPPKDKVAGEASADGAKQKPEPWYPFEAGRPKAQPEVAHASTSAQASTTPATSAAPASPADFKKDAQASQMDKLVRSEPLNLFDRLKPEPSVIRPAWEQSTPFVEKEKVSLASAAKPQAAGGERSGTPNADGAKVAKSEAAPAARVHVHPPTPPRSAFGNVLHAEAKEMNRANGVLGSALAQGLHPDAIKAVVENRLQGHAREIANNVLAGATDAEGMAAKLADSQKVASALQAAASKAVNADHAEVIVASRLKGDAAVAGVSAVQALAGAAPSITVSEQQLAAAAPLVSSGALDLPEIKVAGQPELTSTATVAQQAIGPESTVPAAPAAVLEQPQVAAADPASVVTQPVPMPESQPLPMAEQPQVAASDSGVVTFPVPTPESQPLPQVPNSDMQAMTESLVSAAASAAKPEVLIEDRSAPVSAVGEGVVAGAMASAASSAAQAAQVEGAALNGAIAAAAKPEVPIEERSTPVSSIAEGLAAGAMSSAAGSAAQASQVEGAALSGAIAAAIKPEVLIEERSTPVSSIAEGLAAGAMSSAAGSVAQAAQNTQIEGAVLNGSNAAAAGAMSTAASELLSAKMGETLENSSKPAVVIEDRSTRAAVEDTAAVTAKLETPTSYSNLVGDKLRDAFSAATSLSDTVSSAVQGVMSKGEDKPQVAAETVAQASPSAASVSSARMEAPIEERSTHASQESPTKSNVVIEDRSTQATLADSTAASAKMESNTSYSSMAGDKLRDAFSLATNVSETVSKAVDGGLAKGEAKLQSAADSVAQVIQVASSAGAKVSLEDALTSHMQDKGFDSQSIAAASQIAQAIRDDMRSSQPQSDSMLVLHKKGAELASVVQAKDVSAVARPGDSVLAMDTLEKVAAKGMDQNVIKELRGAMPEAVQNRSDLELAQSVGPAKSEMKGLDQAQNPQQEAQRQEKSAAAEQSRDAAAAMSMG